MRKKYHTLEEVRGANAEAQKRWREKHRWEHLQRVKAVYGKSQEQKNYEGGVSPRDLEKERKREAEAALVTNEVCETTVGPVEGVDEPWAEVKARKEARRAYEWRRGGDRGPAKVVVESAEERRVREWLGRKTDPGVEVDLEMP